jgi:succinate dehydrogenase/fumarate reductase flavoprotein subunit
MDRLPRVYQTLMDLQLLDITTTPIEIAPTAHYSMGGVWVRHEDHSTGVEGLYAIGEASSGLHGANRLGGNSLSNCSSTAKSSVERRRATQLGSMPNNVLVPQFPLPATRYARSSRSTARRTSDSSNERCATR